MRVLEDPAHTVAILLNCAWLVRHYVRGARSTIGREQRQQAILDMGLAVRDAFNSSDPAQYESLLAAIVDGLRPRDEPPF